jgi:hypothetical protein
MDFPAPDSTVYRSHRPPGPARFPPLDLPMVAALAILQAILNLFSSR